MDLLLTMVWYTAILLSCVHRCVVCCCKVRDSTLFCFVVFMFLYFCMLITQCNVDKWQMWMRIYIDVNFPTAIMICYVCMYSHAHTHANTHTHGWSADEVSIDIDEHTPFVPQLQQEQMEKQDTYLASRYVDAYCHAPLRSIMYTSCLYPLIYVHQYFWRFAGALMTYSWCSLIQ